MSPSKRKDESFFDKFDDVTITKLDIYARYLQEWLPVPLSGRMYVKEAVIYDLFCGPGADATGVQGSPLRAKAVIEKNEDTIRDRDIPVRLVFNDYEPKYISSLRGHLGTEIAGQDGPTLATVRYHSEAFQDLFPRLMEEMSGSSANLLFIDQFGMTNVSEEIFRAIHSLKKTDVLFFVSSDWFRRFAGRPEAADWGISKEDVSSVQYSHIHRFVTDHFRRLVGGDYFVAPFSLKKGSNIYGLVFASHSELGLRKFLDVAWEKDPYSGEANFDLFGDHGENKDQVSMFDTSKVLSFQTELKDLILSGAFASDYDIYIHMLQRGFIPKHAKPVLSELRAGSSPKIEFLENGVRVRHRFSQDCVKQPRQLIVIQSE